MMKLKKNSDLLHNYLLNKFTDAFVNTKFM
jgi:hypothetical protein